MIKLVKGFVTTTDFTNFSIIFLDYHLQCIYFDGNKIIFFVYKIGKLKHSFKRMKYLFRVEVVVIQIFCGLSLDSLVVLVKIFVDFLISFQQFFDFYWIFC